MVIKLFDVENYIFEISKKKYLSDEFYTVDRLCKKIDVVKKVFKFYTSDLSKKQNNDEISDVAYKSLFGVLKDYRITGLQDYKFLNSALKLNDIMFNKNIINESECIENKQDLLARIEVLFSMEQDYNENT